MNNDISYSSQMLFKSYRKTKLCAYILWLLFCGIGAHRFYLKRKSAWWFVALLVGGLMTSGVLWIPLMLFVLIDLFLIPSMVSEYNDALKHKINFRTKVWL